MVRMVRCIKLEKEAEGLDYPPYPGELGTKLFDNVSKEAWEAWKRIQTMMVNEYRLNMIDPSARKYLKEQMENYFFGDGTVKMVEGWKPENPNGTPEDATGKEAK
ncbi:MAG: oxidative damage protection protein [Oxalobacter sp.]|nr:oxidative damage protection protein [Oxalobacter sp.]